MKWLLPLLLCLCSHAQSVGADPSPVPYDALVTVDPASGPTLYFAVYGDATVVSTVEPPSVSFDDSQPTAIIEWTSGTKTVTVAVPKKPSEDDGSWKRRVASAVASMEAIFPPNPPATGRVLTMLPRLRAA